MQWLLTWTTIVQTLDPPNRTTAQQSHLAFKRNPRITSQKVEDRSIFVTLTDLDVLDCCICYELLHAPVFHCDNGHTACSSCCSKLKNKCPICSSPIGGKRNRAIENVLECLKVECAYAKYGCKETTSYRKRNEHQKACIFAPCLCPHSGCDFIAPCKELYFHCSIKHKDSAARFKCDNYFFMALNVRDKIIVLLEHKGGLFIVLNKKNVEQLGNVVSLSCIGPNSIEKVCYDVMVKYSDGSCLALHSFTKNNPASTIANGSRAPKTKSLVIPSDFFDSSGSGQLKLKISSSACSKYLIV